VIVWQWVQQHRLLTILILAFVIVSSAGGTAWALVFRTVSSPVGLREALRIYRREQAEKVLLSLRNHLPAPGVYSYRTSGGEGLSLMGVQRGFPTTTSMVVTDGRCAAVSWVPIAEHTETTRLCPAGDGALAVPEFVTHESIAGTTTTSTVDCPVNAYLLPPGTAPGRSWRATCSLRSPSERVVLRGEDLGPATVAVGGRSIEVEHTRLTLRYSGGQAGTNPTDFWIVPSTGLIVREHESASMTQGGVHYSETMQATLSSLDGVR
jgi:hypothetical protein